MFYEVIYDFKLKKKKIIDIFNNSYNVGKYIYGYIINLIRRVLNYIVLYFIFLGYSEVNKNKNVESTIIPNCVQMHNKL